VTRPAAGGGFPWAWLILGFVLVVAGLAALAGWRTGQSTVPVSTRAYSAPVADGARFGPPQQDAPADPSEQAVSVAETHMKQQSLPDAATAVTYGHLRSATQGIDADVWLVAFPGYCTVSTGTPGVEGPQGIARTLVVVDATTGEVLTTLVDVDWRGGCGAGSIGSTIQARGTDY